MASPAAASPALQRDAPWPALAAALAHDDHAALRRASDPDVLRALIAARRCWSRRWRRAGTRRCAPPAPAMTCRTAVMEYEESWHARNALAGRRLAVVRLLLGAY